MASSVPEMTNATARAQCRSDVREKFGIDGRRGSSAAPIPQLKRVGSASGAMFKRPDRGGDPVPRYGVFWSSSWGSCRRSGASNAAPPSTRTSTGSIARAMSRYPSADGCKPSGVSASKSGLPAVATAVRVSTKCTCGCASIHAFTSCIRRFCSAVAVLYRMMLPATMGMPPVRARLYIASSCR